MYERFTDRARRVMQFANQEAQRFNHELIDTEHVLLGLVKEGQGLAVTLLTNLGINLRKVRLELEKRLSPGPERILLGKKHQTPEAKQVIEFAMEEARELPQDHVGTEHILLGLLRVPSGVGAQVLASFGVEFQEVRQKIATDSGLKSIRDSVSSAVHTEAVRQIKTKKSEVTATRIVDASNNRAAEGLRVVEDYVRLGLDDAHLTELCKHIRHDLGTLSAKLNIAERASSRDTLRDVGTRVTAATELTRINAFDVCRASCERVKQSLRSMEESCKILAPEMSGQYEALRYRFYTLEKALVIAHNSQSRLDGAHLCVLVDGANSADEFSEQVTKLVDTGVGMIQLRDKQLDDRQLLERAKLLKSLATRDSQPATQHPTTLAIINDRADIAAAAGADGVHLGQDDLSVKDACAILGPRKLIGVSTHSIEQAHQAVLDGANYLGAGPTFPSSTKSFDEFPGLDYLRQVAAEISLPTFAIGGINADNLPQVLETGITRIAVSSASKQAAELIQMLKK